MSNSWAARRVPELHGLSLVLYSVRDPLASDRTNYGRGGHRETPRVLPEAWTSSRRPALRSVGRSRASGLSPRHSAHFSAEIHLRYCVRSDMAERSNRYRESVRRRAFVGAYGAATNARG